MINWSKFRIGSGMQPPRLRQVEGKEWWLWALALIVTLVLTFCILTLTFPGLHLPMGEFYLLNLREWVRGLAALVLLFDVYTVYQRIQLQRIRRQLAERERLFQLISEHAADMIAVIDRHGRRVYNSPAYEKILGYSREELAATSSLEQVHPDDRARVLEAAEKAHATGRGERLEYRVRHKDGSWRILESTSSAIPGPKGDTEGLVIVNRDVTERKRAEALLEHRAFHDDLTSLPNRALFLDRLQRAITLSQRHENYKFAVLFIDVDEFRLFNDSLGHSIGDELLIQIAQRLTTCMRRADTVSRGSRTSLPSIGESTLARPGGDEFVVLAEEVHDASDGVKIAERIQQRLELPFCVHGHDIVVTASIGVAFSTNTGCVAHEVLRDAETAMYRAKRGGKAHCEVFDMGMHAEAVKRLRLETDLRRAAELNEFCVHYQPLIALETGRIIGCEALTRWQRPEGLVMPGEFITVADEIGVILTINRNLLWECCLQLGRWHQLFPAHPPLRISLNMTAKQFGDPELPSQIDDIIQQTGVDPGCLDLEITETIAVSNDERAELVLRELKSLGVRLSIDDFGTGYSSLCRLQRLPFDTLKIDRSFVAPLSEDEDAREIVRVIILLAHNLGLEVVAEGIETQDQMGMLKGMGCDIGQGFHFSRAVAPLQLEQLLTERRNAGVSLNYPSSFQRTCNLADTQEV